MTDLPGLDVPTAAAWDTLVGELDRWRQAGEAAALWWRDDDAVAATPRLERLLSLAGATPLGLAVIPALARPDLSELLANAPQVAVLQHGWRHANHAEFGKKSEYPEGRAGAIVADEVAAGRGRLAALFGDRFLPIFVPPWNRIAPEFRNLLTGLGVKAISTMAAVRSRPMPSTGLSVIDVHIDLVAWRKQRRFLGTDAALGELIFYLRMQRLGGVRGPIGVLTHHLVMDDAAAVFMEQLLALTSEHCGAEWISVGRLLQ